MRNKDGNLLQFTEFHCISLCAKRKMAPFSFRISKVLLPCVSSGSWECWWERQSHSDIGSLAVPGFSLWKPEGWSLFCSLMTGLGGGLWSSILLGTHRAGSISTFTLFRTRNLKIISSVIFCLLFPFRFLDILSHSDIGLLYLSFFFPSIFGQLYAWF